MSLSKFIDNTLYNKNALFTSLSAFLSFLSVNVCDYEIDKTSFLDAIKKGKDMIDGAVDKAKGAVETAPFYHVVFMNFSRHLGQVMEIFPLPLGTLTC